MKFLETLKRNVNSRSLLLLQVPLVLLILAFIPGNFLKLVCIVLVSILGFGRLSKREIFLFISSSIVFSLLNIATLSHHIFAFNHPDLFGLPYYEFFMWGFYLLHTNRLLEGEQPKQNIWAIALLALLYAAAFAFIENTNVLLLTTSLLLITNLAFYHERMDILYTLYFIILGAFIEYTGVHSGQWHYFTEQIGGVPLWFVTLWGGVGFFLRRLVSPLLNSKARFLR